jgi:hypothetical protein
MFSKKHWNITFKGECEMIPELGKRVKLITDIVKFPHFIAKKGQTGTIVEYTEELVSVKLDETVEGAETWDNCVHLYFDELVSEYLDDEVDSTPAPLKDAREDKKEELMDGLIDLYNNNKLSEEDECSVLNILEYLGFDIKLL